jgi:hypothetical protein
MIEFLRKITFGQVAATLLLLFYMYLGIHLSINEPFDFFGFFIYLLFFSLFAFIWFCVCMEVKSSRPTKFFIIEVEKWLRDDYKKVYFI